MMTFKASSRNNLAICPRLLSTHDKITSGVTQVTPDFMPEKEPREPVEHHQTPNPEQEAPAYYRAARFPREEEAGRSYHAAQRLIRDPDVDLSAYRLQLNRIWHVAILGPTTPPEEIAKKVEEILSSGKPVTLQPDILEALLVRRKQALSPGTTWLERHYRPGKRL